MIFLLLSLLFLFIILIMLITFYLPFHKTKSTWYSIYSIHDRIKFTVEHSGTSIFLMSDDTGWKNHEKFNIYRKSTNSGIDIEIKNRITL